MSAATYEFTLEQNDVVQRLASRMRVVGRALMILAVLLAVWAFVPAGTGGSMGLVAAVALGLTGVWSERAGTALARVVRMEGADIAHLMRALAEMRKLYDFQYWLFVGLALLVGATLLVAITGLGVFPAAW